MVGWAPPCNSAVSARFTVYDCSVRHCCQGGPHKCTPSCCTTCLVMRPKSKELRPIQVISARYSGGCHCIFVLKHMSWSCSLSLISSVECRGLACFFVLFNGRDMALRTHKCKSNETRQLGTLMRRKVFQTYHNHHGDKAFNHFNDLGTARSGERMKKWGLLERGCLFKLQLPP